ncbi:hypothetical protein H6G76_32110 [Nostoc sp. FACHB-152]|uniref:salt stress protein, Slr1339 family n=1 Tax=unclassified Nostoc TaxID=2593658 RepID=UPI00168689FC|nr:MULTISPECIES: hypothetical protein [unclassified Nostoc]MBD2451682.1 hypothetical protein [Nostoc sp. FACHB-152]MBD2472784.1 hypothetical protein [Nostoc sp. FACHB-145]
MDSIDKLLAQLKAEYEEPKPTQQQPPDFVKPAQQPSQPDMVKPIIISQPKSRSIIDNILAEVKADVEAQAAAEELRRQQELEQERLRQEKIKAQQLAALGKQAKEWLEKLDPFSPEGLWFERFAEGYPSKLEAAIEYLQSNQ